MELAKQQQEENAATSQAKKDVADKIRFDEYMDRYLQNYGTLYHFQLAQL